MVVGVVIASASIGYVLLGTSKTIFGGGQSTGSGPSTAATTGAESATAPSTVCIVPVEGGGTYLRIVSDSTLKPLAGISAVVTPKANQCFGTSKPAASTYNTNGSGWISIPGLQANYYFLVSVGYDGKGYNFVLPQGPLDSTYARFSLPSGNLSISSCNDMDGQNPCRSSEATVTITQGKATTVTLTFDTSTAPWFTKTLPSPGPPAKEFVVTTTVTDSAGTTTVSECATTVSVTVTQYQPSSAQTTVTFTQTVIVYGSTVTISGCQTLITTTTITQTT